MATLLVIGGCALDQPYDHDQEILVLGGKADGVAEKKTWTFMLYGAADNNLAPEIFHDVNELESIGSTRDVNFLALLDQPQGAQVMYLLQDANLGALTSPRANWGQLDSGDVNTLITFADWAMASYPADRYALVISGHGGGSPRVIAPDFSTGHSIAVQSLESALHRITYDRGRRVELFGADACLMQTVEVAYQLRFEASYVVASENSEPGDGWNYAAIARALTNRPTMWGRELGSNMVRNYEAYYHGTHSLATLASLDTAEFLRPPTAVDEQAAHNFADHLRFLAPLVAQHAATPAGRSELLAVLRDVARVYDGYDDYGDVLDFLALLETRVSSSQLRLVAGHARAAARYLIATSWVDPEVGPRIHGLSMYLPQSATASAIAAYRTHYELAKEGWADAIAAIHGL